MKGFLLMALLPGIVKCSANEPSHEYFNESFRDDGLKSANDFVSVLVSDFEDRELMEATKSEYVGSTFSSITKDRLSELEDAERDQINRFMEKINIPGRLILRLGEDHSYGSVDYSYDALYACFTFLELPPEYKEQEDTKKRVLQSLFELFYTSNKGFKGLSNSFLHPLCFDAMKYLGDSLQSHQIDLLISNVPGVIFENFELLTSLKDYSFLTLEVYANSVKDFKTISAVDFLAIPAFVKTCHVDLLMVFLSTAFEPSRHWNILLENRGLAELIKHQHIREDPLFYPFFIGIGSPEYLADSSDIIGVIRSKGLTNLILASLISYVQITNEAIQRYMTEIATIWADLHKNSHLILSPDINKEFNELIKPKVEYLSFIRIQRENVNELIKDFEEGKISIHQSIIKKCPDWLEPLKVLVQTPFNAFIRSTFATRFSKTLMASNHPDDEGNIVRLPRLLSPTSSGVCGINSYPDPAKIFHPLVWSCLWREIFCKVGVNDAKISNYNIDEAAEFKNEAIYRDNNFGVIQLIDAWMKLAPVLPEIFCNGPRLLNFIASISIPAPPEGLELPEEQLNERKEFAKKVVDVTKEIRLVDKVSVDIIKHNLKDSEEAVKVMDELSKIVPNGPQSFTFSIKKLEAVCATLNSIANCRTLQIPDFLFSYLTTAETGFASLGTTLTEAQIREIGKSEEINKLLARHGRSLLRSQVKGLLESETGRLFLKSNKPMLASLLDYSSFKPGDFEDLDIGLDEIKMNLSTAHASVKLLNLTKKGFSTFNDPVRLVCSLAYNVWAVKNNCKNFGLWELLNPIVLAFDLDMTYECSLIPHMTDLKYKLHEKVLLNMALVFVTKWLIAQDWYAFVYNVAVGKDGKIFGANILKSLSHIYVKYLIEGEIPGRKYLISWLQSASQGRTSEGKNEKEKEDIISGLAALSAAVETVPLTPFREIINQSPSNVFGLLARPFSSQVHSPSLLHHVRSLITNYFKSNEKVLWLNRLEILSQFSLETGKLKNSMNSSALARSILSSMPTFDSLIYKWALELEGVNVESIFRNFEKDDFEINANAPGVVSVVPVKISEVKVETAKETKKDKKNKKKR